MTEDRRGVNPRMPIDDNIPPHIFDFIKKSMVTPSVPLPVPETFLYEIEWSDGTKEIIEAHSVMLQGGHGMPFPIITFGRIDPEKVRTDPSDMGDFIKMIPVVPNPTKMVIQVTKLENAEEMFKDDDIPRS